MAPSIRDVTTERSVAARETRATASTVNTKFPTVSVRVPRRAVRRTLRSRSIPPSKRMTTRVMVVKTGPRAPKWAEDTIPRKGPRISPIIMSRSTSGTLVRLNISANRWDANIRIPTETIIGATSIIYLSQGIMPCLNLTYHRIDKDFKPLESDSSQ